MSNRVTTAILVGAFSALSLGLATAGQPSEAGLRESPQTAPDHAVSGVVKSIDATTLVITRPRKTPGEMTFALDSSTEREGPVAVGDTIEVRYHTDGHTLVATAIRGTGHKRLAGPVASAVFRVQPQCVSNARVSSSAIICASRVSMSRRSIM
jgi:hypothetical protein